MNYKVKVGSIILNDKDQILLIKERFTNSKVPLWNIITGTYGDNDPETVHEAAARECFEEVSLKIKLIGALGCYIIKEGDDSIRTQLVFLAKIISGEPCLPSKIEQAKRDEDIREFKWFSKEEILNIRASEFVAPRIYIILTDWIRKGKSYPLDIYKDMVIK